MKRRAVTLWSIAALAAAAGSASIYGAYRRDVSRSFDDVTDRSQTIETPFGTMEYATAGTGRPVLMIHGTGGGFDQGLAFAEPLVEAGWKIVAPSRFGYLRSTFPDDPSLDNQADALARLLDHLQIDRLPVMGGSAGALSALQFAIRHPSRCSAVIAIVPATFVPQRPPVRPSPLGAAIMEYGLHSDFLFWAGLMLARDKMVSTLLATDPEIVHRASPRERARVQRILRGILPVSARSKGLINDGRQAGTPPQQAIETIAVPTLAISVEDDRFGTAEAARYIAATVRGAELIIFPSGGHVWVGHDRDLWVAVDAFLRKL